MPENFDAKKENNGQDSSGIENKAESSAKNAQDSHKARENQAEDPAGGQAENPRDSQNSGENAGAKNAAENAAADASEGSDFQNSSAKNGAAENASGDFSENKGAHEASGENSDAENPENQDDSDEESSSKQPIMQHIAALRKVIINSLIAILAASVICISFLADWLVEMLSRPIANRGIQIIYTAVSEALVTKLKVSLVAGLIFASPYVFYQLWSFLKPALYQKEQKKFRLMFFVIVALFLLGILFCYGVVYSLALDFFLVAGEGLAQPMLSIDKYIGYMFSFAIPFGIAFQVPVIIYITTSIGLTTTEGLKKARRYVILGIAVLAALLTPPDVVSQLLMAVPMLVLYELSIFISARIKPRGIE
ncbi:MAG: twin-arginine translocase subunit TatC [Christensenellales bacterium]